VKKQYTGKLMEIVWEMYIARTRGDERTFEEQLDKLFGRLLNKRV